MIRPWRCVLRVTESEARLLVTDPETGDVLRARLPMPPRHPRALLTLLEGLALFAGERLSVVISAATSSVPWLGSGLFGDELWPPSSALVTFVVEHLGRRRRLARLGDLRTVRRGKLKVTT